MRADELQEPDYFLWSFFIFLRHLQTVEYIFLCATQAQNIFLLFEL